MKINGVKTVNRNGKTYYYHRKTSQRLPGEYGSREFLDRLGDLHRQFGNKPQRSDGAPGALKVYFVQSGSAVKIGKTDGPVHNRIHDLQTGNPVRLKLLGWCLAGETLEPELHYKYRKQRIHGEWFKLTPGLKAEIRERNNERRRCGPRGTRDGTRTEQAAETFEIQGGKQSD